MSDARPAAPALPREAAPRVGARAIASLVLALTGGSLRNQTRRRLGRLRRPRYLLALVVGGAYIWFAILRNSGNAQLGQLVSPVVEPLMALGLTVLAATWWLSPRDQQALAFTMAEAHLLFPAPVPRRALLLWKVLRAQGAILLSTIIWVALVRGGATTSGWLRAIALWGLFSTMHLHRLGVQLAHASRAARHDEATARAGTDPGPAPVAWLPLAVLALLGALLGVALYPAVPALRAAGSPLALVEVLAGALAHPAGVAALAPARVAIAPLFAMTAAEWLPRALAAAGFLALHYAWVLARDVPFEEAAMNATTARIERRAARGRKALAAVRGRWLSARLAATGHPAVAVTWKNVLGWLRSARPGPIIVGALVIAVMNVFLAGDEGSSAQVIVSLAAAFGVLLVMFGPMLVRADLRQDLAHLDLLRAWPLGGGALVAAEVAGATIILLGMQVAFGLLVLAALAVTGSLNVSAPTLGTVAASLALALPAVDAAHLALHNTVAVLFPDWVRPDRERIGGIETTGQGMIVVVAMLVALWLLLLLPLLLGGGTLAAFMHVAGTWRPDVDIVLSAGSRAGWLAAIAVASVVLLAETALLVRWAGRVLARTEPAELK